MKTSERLKEMRKAAALLDDSELASKLKEVSENTSGDLETILLSVDVLEAELERRNLI